MIRLILPTYEGHFGLSSAMAQRFAKLGDMKQRKATVVLTWANHFDTEGYIDFLRKNCFAEVDLAILEDTPEDEGWPVAGNHLFYGAMLHLAKIKNEDPWFFLEPDMFFTHKGALNHIEEEYDRVGKPYMGVVNDTRFRDKKTGELHLRGKHLVGTAIYPADFINRSKAIHLLTDIPWDIDIQDEVMPEAHDSKQFFHCFGTHQYHFTKDGELIGRDAPRKTKNFHSYVRPVPTETAVLHGCKDDSLYKLWADPANEPFVRRFGPQA